ncbi:MAG: endonuclease [Bacteroidales bacterium]|nr:endonuclease [Bacteroidales bacterium]
MQKNLKRKPRKRRKSRIELWMLLVFSGALIYITQQCSIYRPSKENLTGETTAARGDFRILFYNVENLFDTRQDSLTKDEDFLPEGTNRWTYTRYTDKLNKIFKVIVAAGGREAPEIVGLCEVENRLVLEDLLRKTPLDKAKYKIVHRDSPDPRGIDVALLYRPEKFTLLHWEFIPITHANGMIAQTREMIYTKGLLSNQDTLHVFVCHWPSKLNGAASEKLRNRAAERLRSKTDSLLRVNPASKILIGGDLNDAPESPTIQQHLLAQSFNELLINLSAPDKDGTGTYSYQGQWDLIDQIIVSKPLTKTSNPTHISAAGYQIFSRAFLLEYSEKALVTRPFRTYRGPMYLGGYSDHLPVFTDLVLK